MGGGGERERRGRNEPDPLDSLDLDEGTKVRGRRETELAWL